MYLEQLEAMNEEMRKEVCEAMLDTMYAIADQLTGLEDNHTVIVKDLDEYNNPNNKQFIWHRQMCLEWLAEGAEIIELRYEEDYAFVSIGSAGTGYIVSVINRYAFEDLMLALSKVEARLTNYDGYDKSEIENRTTPNLVYYNTATGRGLVNGKPVNLRGRNRRLFNALFLAAPRPIGDDTLLRIVRTYKHDELGDKYLRNDAFSALRKACKKVDNTVIVQRGGGRLNARVFPLSFQLPKATFYPKK